MIHSHTITRKMSCLRLIRQHMVTFTATKTLVTSTPPTVMAWALNIKAFNTTATCIMQLVYTNKTIKMTMTNAQSPPHLRHLQAECLPYHVELLLGSLMRYLSFGVSVSHPTPNCFTLASCMDLCLQVLFLCCFHARFLQNSRDMTYNQ